MTIRIIITGSRWTTGPETRYVEHTLVQLVRSSTTEQAEGIVLIHGACPTGVDHIVNTIGHTIPGVFRVEAHPADWGLHGPNAGPLRNAAMVALGARWCVGFPHADSRGTWDCLRKAAEAGIPGRIYPLEAAR